jgi:uncharacterized protein YggU (UPF0235/DUF167 family)
MHVRVKENTMKFYGSTKVSLLERNHLRYSIFVKFDSGGKIHVDGSEITKSKPERNKANREKLATYFGTSKDRICIIAGMTSSKKLVDIMEERK